MKKGTPMPERDREATEQRLIDTIGEMICQEGFERLGINAIAARSGVSKILIYRYFCSVDGLIAAYIGRHDFWTNIPTELPTREQLPEFIKTIYREQINRFRRDPLLKRLLRWELSSDNALITRLRQQREEAGQRLLADVCRISGRNEKETTTLATILASSITYLALLAESFPHYNGIPLDQDQGWEQIACGIDRMIDDWFSSSQ